MAKAASPIPKGFHTVNPQLTIKQGAAKYIDFLKQAFDAVELSRAPGPDGKLLHADVRIGDSIVMLNDHFPEFGSPPIPDGEWPLTLHMYVLDADAIFAKATAAGCQIIMPIADQFWGDHYGVVNDPFGFRWAIATRNEDLTQEEMYQRQAKMFGGQ